MHLKNKTVLITGADGFIGSHLTETLVKEGAKVKESPNTEIEIRDSLSVIARS